MAVKSWSWVSNKSRRSSFASSRERFMSSMATAHEDHSMKSGLDFLLSAVSQTQEHLRNVTLPQLHDGLKIYCLEMKYSFQLFLVYEMMCDTPQDVCALDISFRSLIIPHIGAAGKGRGCACYYHVINQPLNSFLNCITSCTSPIFAHMLSCFRKSS